MRFPRMHLPRFSRKLLILPPVLLGVVVLVVAAASRRGPEQEPVEEQPRVLTVFASTILVLLVIPSLYAVLNDFGLTATVDDTPEVEGTTLVGAAGLATTT